MSLRNVFCMCVLHCYLACAVLSVENTQRLTTAPLCVVAVIVPLYTS